MWSVAIPEEYLDKIFTEVIWINANVNSLPSSVSKYLCINNIHKTQSVVARGLGFFGNI